MKNDVGRVSLGPRDGSGYEITVLRGFDDGTDDYARTYVEYTCHGVEDIDIDSPWDVGGGRNCFINVHFTNGSRISLTGVVTEIELPSDDSRETGITKTTNNNKNNNNNNAHNNTADFDSSNGGGC